MHTFKAALALTLPILAATLPTASNNGSDEGISYYSLTGYNPRTTDSHLLSILSNQNLLPYYESFWFGLPKDHWCKAPQPGDYTNFSCNADTYKPLYTIDGELELATSYVTNRILRAESGQVAYAYGSAEGGWSLTSDNLLAYQGDTTFHACPETRGDAGPAYQLWQGTSQDKGGDCVELGLKAEKVAAEAAANLPYGYGGN